MQQGPGPRPFDVTPRQLIEGDPVGWLAWAGLPVDGPVHPIDTEISTVLAEVDKVLRVDGPSPWLAHFELQSSRDPDLPFRLLVYCALLVRHHRQPIETTVILLRPAVDHPELSGRFEWPGPTGEPTLTFRFRVIRLWQRPVEELLDGSLSLLPLAPLAAVGPADLPRVIHRLNERLADEATPDRADLLWAATFLLLDLRYDREDIKEILSDMNRLRESTAYQIILEEGREEGRLEGARQTLIALGTEKFGPPDAATLASLEGDASPERIERLARRVLGSSSWQELLATD
jgi:predicted transposase YdaD